MSGVLIRRGNVEARREEDHVTMKADIEAMHVQAEEC